MPGLDPPPLPSTPPRLSRSSGVVPDSQITPTMPCVIVASTEAGQPEFDEKNGSTASRYTPYPTDRTTRSRPGQRLRRRHSMIEPASSPTPSNIDDIYDLDVEVVERARSAWFDGPGTVSHRTYRSAFTAIRCRCALIVAPEDDPTGEHSSSRTR